MKRWILAAAIVTVLAGAGGYAFWKYRQKSNLVAYRTAKVEQGDVVQTVRATGVVRPLLLVQVGTQVNGPVKKLYVDFNSKVKAGDLVAQIDPIVYEARLAQDRASLLQNEANVEQFQAKLVQASNDLVRAQELARRDLLSKSDLDAAVANRDTLAAQLKVTRAAVEQSRATLQVSQANLDYTTIRSPVDGVVIDRSVDEGQTVVASMTAQTLYTIATDLRQVQIEATIPEADIGKIREDQPVSFTVDAYDEEFHGTVSQVRLDAATVQNVVTYPVIVRADNPDTKLFPGMTANIICEVGRRNGVLKIPNAALRFKPADAGADKTDKTAKPADRGDRKGPGRPAGTKTVWAPGQPGTPPVPVQVKLGIADVSFTELTEAGGLAAGVDIITGLAAPGEKQAAVVNPFMPQMPGRGGQPRPASPR